METPIALKVVRKPLYQQVADLITKEYIEGKPEGVRLPSEIELEKLCGVSLITVRAALRELESRQVVDRRPGSGTYVAGKKPASRHVALLLDVEISSDNLSPFYVNYLRALREEFRQAGIPYRPYLGTLPLNAPIPETITCQELLDDVEMGRISGIFGLFVSLKPYWGTPFLKRGIRVLDNTYMRRAYMEHEIRSAFSYFRDQNRRSIAIMGCESRLDAGRNIMHERLFELAPEYGLTLQEPFVKLDADAKEYGMGWERFRDIWSSSPVKPDGVFIGDDMLFDDCQKAIEELRVSVPDDLLVFVHTSDAYRFSNLRIPIHVQEIQTQPLASDIATAMKALLDGRPLPELKTVHSREYSLSEEESADRFAEKERSLNSIS